MQRCPYCDSKLKKHTKFCPECGMPATWKELDVNALEKKPTKWKLPIIIAFTLLIVATIAFIALGDMDWFNEIPTETTAPVIAFSDNPTAISAASQSVVKLNCYNKNGELCATGSGFACFADNVIVTNYHVIEGGVYSIEASTENGRSFDVTYVLAVDEGKDIAILGTSSSHNLTLLQPGNSGNLQKGEKVVAIGSPLGLLNSVSTGVFSGYVNENSMNLLQFTASISSGSSGGALFNNKGEVLGITFASYEAGQNLNLAIPISQVENIYSRDKSSKITIAEFYGTQTPTYSVDYVLVNYQELIGEEFYIEGWVSVHSYLVEAPQFSWIVVFNNYEDIPHSTDADKQNFNGQITIDEEMHKNFENIILYADSVQVSNTIKTIKTGYYIRALGHITTEYLQWGGVSMDITDVVIIG